jgi:F-type H+-transporting ATPase subunit delta
LKGQIVAGRYAEALFEEAKAQNKLEDVLKGLESVLQLLEDSEDFRVLVKNPLISKDDKQAVLDGMKDSFDKFLFNFLSLLNSKGRLSIVDDIYEELNAFLLAEKGEAIVDITVATELDAGAREEIVKALSEITGKKVTVTETVDSSILGGFVAKIGSDLYDASIKGQMDKIRNKLIS